MNETDFIENAVLKEVERYGYGTFTDHEIVAMEVEAVEICLFRFDPIRTKRKVGEIVSEKYKELYK